MEKIKMNIKKNKSYYDNKQPEFFSPILKNLMYVINSTLGIYLVFNLILISYHLTLSKEFLGDAEYLTKENLLKLLMISLFILSGFVSMNRKSIILFITHATILILINVINFILFSDNNSNKEIISNFLNKSYTLIIITANIIISLYSIYFYFMTIGYFKYDLNNLPISQIVQEINLRADMMKMSYNSFMINMGVYKYLPGVLYKKEDYYFMNEENEVEDQIDKINVTSNNANKDKSFNSNNNTSEDNLNSKSTIDCEYEPLN